MRTGLAVGLATILLFRVGAAHEKCEPPVPLDKSRGPCPVTLRFASVVTDTVIGDIRRITANCIPDHTVGVFGAGPDALNPNPITPQLNRYEIDATPEKAAKVTSLLGDHGPAYRFGILLNGVELDPVAAEPWPHDGARDPDANWEWNLEAMNVQLGLDCNNAHVQRTGKYHYHGSPTGYLEEIGADDSRMTLLGYAADGFPVYYKYGYQDPYDSSSRLIELKSSYQLKAGKRPGDGVSAPCGDYDGVYSADYEYKAHPGKGKGAEHAGWLDECNGREGVTPEYPDGTYYYVITDDFPEIPRYFRGRPSDDFRVAP